MESGGFVEIISLLPQLGLGGIGTALMLVLWLALILHARRGGHVALAGFVNLAALSGLFLAWSWAGVNLMGAGLHSYGFASAGVWATLGYAIAQGALVAGSGLLNRRKRR